MATYRRLAAYLVLLLVACGGGGDGGSSSTCSPAPSINSTPPSSATAGVQYHYRVEWTVACIAFFTDCGFALVQAPSDANAAVTFAIATATDPCGHRATQSWIVIVSP